MITLPNILSLLRIPLAFLFFVNESPFWRSIAIILAMITDGLDGYLARRYKQTSHVGLVLDPLTDKFFVTSVIGIFVFENRLSLLEACSFFSRDAAVFIFGSYLIASHKILDYRFPPFWCGKITTALQLVTLLGLTLNLPIPSYVYWSFLLLGIASMIELFSKCLHKEQVLFPKN